MSTLAHTERPADRRRRRVRQQILDAAERVFAAEGSEGLSMRRLADEIDYSPAAIYKYFNSKEELVDEIREAFFERLLARLNRSDLAGLSFEEKCRHCFGQYVEAAIERPYHYAAAFFSVAGAASEAPGDALCWQAFGETPKGQAFLVLVGLVQEGQARGLIAQESHPWLMARSLWASMHGIAALLIHMPEFLGLRPAGEPACDRAQMITFHCNLLYRGLCQGPPATMNGQSYDP